MNAELRRTIRSETDASRTVLESTLYSREAGFGETAGRIQDKHGSRKSNIPNRGQRPKTAKPKPSAQLDLLPVVLQLGQDLSGLHPVALLDAQLDHILTIHLDGRHCLLVLLRLFADVRSRALLQGTAGDQNQSVVLHAIPLFGLPAHQ